MIKGTFVCLGNICRSPMAELIFKDMLEKEGLADLFEADSCGTSSCEAGNPVYAPAKAALERHGISGTHIARKITDDDFARSDYILAADSENMSYLTRRAAESGYLGKLHRICDFTSRPRDVADPWYTRDFEKTYADVTDGCRGFLEYLKQRGELR